MICTHAAALCVTIRIDFLEELFKFSDQESDQFFDVIGTIPNLHNVLPTVLPVNRYHWLRFNEFRVE